MKIESKEDRERGERERACDRERERDLARSDGVRATRFDSFESFDTLLLLFTLRLALFFPDFLDLPDLLFRAIER